MHAAVVLLVMTYVGWPFDKKSFAYGLGKLQNQLISINGINKVVSELSILIYIQLKLLMAS